MKTCKKNLHQYKDDLRCCPTCHKASIKAWRLANPEHIKVVNRSWTINNQDKKKATSAKRAQTYPEKMAAYASKRRATKLQRTPKWLTQTHLDQIQMFYDSAAALTKELDIPFEVDHIVPLRGELVSGLHVPWNLQVITQSENCSKGNR